MKEMSAEDMRKLLLSLLGSLTLCDHMGDVANDIDVVTKRLGLPEWDSLSDLGRSLGAMGVRTLYDTPLADD